MTLPPPHLVAPPRMGPSHQHAAPVRRNPARVEAVITGACVAAGLSVALATLHPVQTPGRVVEAFVEAGIHEDWSTAWALVCRPTREAVGFTNFTEHVAYVNEYSMAPSDVDVEVEDIRTIHGQNGPMWSVAVRLTSDERNREDWEDRGEVPVVLEDGTPRVCPVPVSPA
jgi:hypothetical protein